MGLSLDTRAVTISTSADIRPAAEALRDIVAEMGNFRAVVVDNIASKQPMVDAEGHILASDVFGFIQPHEQWWTDTRLALHSPVARACRYEGEPFWCNAEGFHTRSPNRYVDAIDLVNFEKRSLTRATIAVPIHLPFGQIGMAGFGVRNGKTDLSAEFEAHADALHLLAHRFISGYVKVMRTRQWLPSDCQLTKREIECLRWAAVGKTDKEISMILARSHATVRFHIQNAGEKLDAVNRSQTIFKAAQLGYLGLAN